VAAGIALLRRRDQVIRQIRAYFQQDGFLEVETPQLSPYACAESHIELFTVDSGEADTRYLLASPEWYMKRLLAEGSGSLFQIGKVFRRGESGRLHNPEFTLLEWYRETRQLTAVMDDCIALLAMVVPEVRVEQWDYRDLFKQHFGADLWCIGDRELAELAAEHGLHGSSDSDTCTDFLFDRMVCAVDSETAWVVKHFPPSKASYAELTPDGQYALRFELFFRGIELANGYSELRDGAVVLERHERVNQERRRQHKSAYPFDKQAATVLTSLPPCAGAAMGIDRLIMLASASRRITDVLGFHFQPRVN